MWTPWTWGEPMFAVGHFFPIPTTRVVRECPEWPIPGVTDHGSGMWSATGNEGWSGGGGGGGEGQPPGSSGTKVQLTLGSHPMEACVQDNGSCRARPKWCWEVGTLLCRYLRSGWIGAHNRWSPMCPELGNIGGGCGMSQGIGGFHGE